MLARRLQPRQLSATGALVRSLSTTSSTQAAQQSRSPALGDITPSGGPAFDNKSREFRERLIAEQEARRRKEQAESKLHVVDSSKAMAQCVATSRIYCSHVLVL